MRPGPERERAGFPPAAPVRWRAKGGRSLRPEALWTGERESSTCARWQGQREEGAVVLPGQPGGWAGGGRQGGAHRGEWFGREGRGRPNLRIEPTAPSALRLIRDPLGRQRIKASLWRRKDGPEAGRARGRAAGRGQKGRSGRTAVGRVSLRPLVAPAGTREPAAPMSRRAIGRAVSPAGAGRKGGPGWEGRAAGILKAMELGVRGVSGGQWAGGMSLRA